MSAILEEIRNCKRSTRYERIRKFLAKGIIEKVNNDLQVNYFSPYTWRIIYSKASAEQVVFRALNASEGILTGMKVIGFITPIPYSEAPIYEVYVPKDRADVFGAIIGLRDDIIVYSSSRSLFKAPLSKTVILAYTLDKTVEYENIDLSYGFSVKEATIEQALVDVIRNDYWYYRGVAFEIYYYARKYVVPEKVLEIAKRFNLEKRLYTIDFVVSETLGVEPMYTIPENMELDRINLVEVIGRLGDVVD